MFVKTIFIWSIFMTTITANFNEDKRCRCVCPTPTSLLYDSTKKVERAIYTAQVPPNTCNCYGVVLPKVADEIRDKAQLFCLRCDCKYETRNTTVIKVVVILVLCILLLLIGYFLFLTLLKSLVSNNQRSYSRVDLSSAESKNLLMQSEDTDDYF